MSARRPMATPEEVAAYLQVSIETVYGWRKKRIGPRASRVGKHLRYRWDDLDTWLDEQAAVAA